MKNLLEKFKDYLKEHKEIVFRILGAIVVVISLSYLAVTFGKLIIGNENQNNKREEAFGDSYGQDSQKETLKKESDPETKNETDKIKSENDNKEITIKVNKAPVDDKEDPQDNNASGLAMDMKNVKSFENEVSQATYGIDVSKWQGIIDWKKVKDSGVEFAMIRVGYRTLDKGIIQEDPYGEYNLQQAVAHDIKIGAYFFSTAISEEEAKEEAKWLTNFIAPYPITYPLAFNCEGFTNPSNRQYGMTKEERTNLGITFLDYVKGKGYQPMFYAAKSELEGNSLWNTSKLSKSYKMWVAQYPGDFTSSSKSSYSGNYHMWQYTSNGKVSGINKPVDLNVAYFGYDKTADPKDNTASIETVKADPTATIDFKEVNEKVTAKEETNLRNLPSTSGSEIIAVLKNGDTTKRIGIGSNGWSKLDYNGKIVYGQSNLLTTDLEYEVPKPAHVNGQYFTQVKEQITAKERVNLRSEPSSASKDTIKGELKYGEVATHTGKGDKGWSRVELNGKTYYVNSNMITSDLNYKTSNKATLDNPEAGITFEPVEEKVTAKEFTNLRLVPSTEIDTIECELVNGDIAIRTGIGNNGWSRLRYKDKTLYAVTNYLMKVEE